MNKLLVYERNIVQCKRKIRNENKDIMFSTDEIIFISKIDTINGLKVFINTGEIISRPKIQNHMRWIKKHFKLI